MQLKVKERIYMRKSKPKSNIISISLGMHFSEINSCKIYLLKSPLKLLLKIPNLLNLFPHFPVKYTRKKLFFKNINLINPKKFQ